MGIDSNTAARVAALTSALPVAGPILGQQLGELIQTVIDQRNEEARAVLLEEMRAGRRPMPHDGLSVDAFVPIVMRYERAAREGANRVKLRLIASAMLGQLENGNPNPDEFARFSSVVETLTDKEIVFLGYLARLWNFEAVGRTALDLSVRIDRRLEESGVFENGAEAHAARSALMRTGFFAYTAEIENFSFLKPTKFMQEFFQSASFERALEEVQRTTEAGKKKSAPVAPGRP